MKSKKLVVGSILSETSFFVVKALDTKNQIVVVKDEFNNELNIGFDYVDKILASADVYETEEKKTMTELAEGFLNSARIAMTVAFYKKDVVKSGKKFKEEVANAVKKVQNAKVSEVEGLLKDLIENPISKSTPGEFREMKGKHNGYMNKLGRVDFKDMEDPTVLIKQVDPRSIQYYIVNGVKYSLE
jgi:hypothetical protein